MDLTSCSRWDHQGGGDCGLVITRCRVEQQIVKLHMMEYFYCHSNSIHESKQSRIRK
jgi:hypothetical protein